MLKAISGWGGLDWDACTLEHTSSMSTAPPNDACCLYKILCLFRGFQQDPLEISFLSFSGWGMAWTPSVHARLGTREMWRLRLLFVCSDPCMTLVWLNRTLQTFSSWIFGGLVWIYRFMSYFNISWQNSSHFHWKQSDRYNDQLLVDDWRKYKKVNLG